MHSVHSPIPHEKPNRYFYSNPPINNVKLSTVVPEHETFDCSFTHVLQAPNTYPYNS